MAGKAWEGTQLLPENRTTNDIVRSSKLDGTGGNGFYIDAVNIALRDIQRTLNQAQALLASSGAAITAGQGYIIDNGGVLQLPTGISLMRVRGINLPAGVKGFSANAQAYVTALSTWVDCSYDVANNVAQFDYLLWAGHISQAGTAAPTVGVLNYNISGETPTFGYISEGVYSITFSGGKLVAPEAVKHYSVVYDGEQQGFYTVEGSSTVEALIKCFRSGAFADDRLDNSYIEIRLVYTP